MADNFLAFTAKHGWVVVQPGTGGWTGYFTVPGRYSVTDQEILERADLPPAPRHPNVTAPGKAAR